MFVSTKRTITATSESEPNCTPSRPNLRGRLVEKYYETDTDLYISSRPPSAASEFPTAQQRLSDKFSPNVGARVLRRVFGMQILKFMVITKLLVQAAVYRTFLILVFLLMSAALQSENAGFCSDKSGLCIVRSEIHVSFSKEAKLFLESYSNFYYYM